MSTYFQSLLVLLNFGLKFLYTLLVDSYNIFLYITDSVIRYLCIFCWNNIQLMYIVDHTCRQTLFMFFFWLFEYIVKKIVFFLLFSLGGAFV